MIPADVASRLQVSADAAQRPVAPAQEIADKLPGLVAGQKVMAEIQTLLPNGTYRALINQRSITLALPFAAKSGDALELQVTESNGKLALAVLSRPGGENAQSAAPGTAATLSRTGQLIATLFSGVRQARDSGGNSPALALNGNQPLSAGLANAQNLLPMLRQAIAQSGMFYEAHQAEWVAGRFTQAALLQEPQGKLSSPAAFSQAAAQTSTTAGQPAGEPNVAQRVLAESGQSPGAATEAGKSGTAQHAGQLIAPQTQVLVQQQLEALATQNFSWQGQVWPGQEMRWEIDEDGRRHGQTNEEGAAQWTTRLRLTLPHLGNIDAQIRLRGDEIGVSMSADTAETRTLLRASSIGLRRQLDEAGLTLGSIGVDASDNSDERSGDGQTSE